MTSIGEKTPTLVNYRPNCLIWPNQPTNISVLYWIFWVL